MTTARQRVLLVDDEPQMLVALEDLLCDDFEVFKTESPERALRLVEEEGDIAVVISDQRMPRMNGDELFTRLDGQSQATRILVTGFADLSGVIRAVNNGKIFAYVTKPWNPEDLRLIVRKGAEYFRLGRELAYERQLLHDLMENIPEGIFFKDRDLRYVRVNRVLANMLNEPESARFVGKRLDDIAPESSETFGTEALERQLLVVGDPVVDAVRTFTRAGRRRWVSESKAPIKSPDGRVIGLVGIARDVTESVHTQEALRTSEERLQLVFRGSAAGLFDWNVLDGEISYSPSFGTLLGYDQRWSPSLQELFDLIHPDDVPRLRRALGEHFGTRTPFNGLELRARIRDGSYHWFQASGQAVWDEHGAATRLAGSITDITHRKQQEDRIARLTRIHAVLGGITSAIVRISERDALMNEACRIAVEVGEFTLAAIIAFGPDDETTRIVAVKDREGKFSGSVPGDGAPGQLFDAAVLRRVVATSRAVIVNDVEAEGLGPGVAPESPVPYRALAVFPLVVGDRVEVSFALFSETKDLFDSEESKLLEELAANLSFALAHIAQTAELDLLSYYDGLTGLPNRDLLRDRIARSIVVARNSATKLAVALFDIDRFRHVNETLGWPAGDELLTVMARRLEGALPREHTLSRCGSNTFALLVAPVDEEADVALLVERGLLEATKLSYSVHGTEIRTSVRTGIAVFPSDGQAPDALLGNAETALKNARTSGQRYVFYAPRMNARVAEKLDLETRLRRAIENEEFLLHYQPKMDCKSGKLAGLEALIRWKEPSGTLVSPAQFIPVLEDTGLILEVGRWVMESAAAQFCAWTDAGLVPPRIAVNVSALQLAQEGFVPTLDAVLARFPKAAGGLDLEITESVFGEDMAGNAEKLSEARKRGLQVAIDDFGTGYSSLGYLSRLPIDALKIDRSFVIRMVENAHDTSIVTTIIALAHSLELKVIAEGVETQEQAHLLRLLRCDQLQGYLIARPQPSEQVVSLLSIPVPFAVRVGKPG